jgi:hypothetical protein
MRLLIPPPLTELNELGGEPVIDGRLLVADASSHRTLSLRLDSGEVEDSILREWWSPPAPDPACLGAEINRPRRS